MTNKFNLFSCFQQTLSVEPSHGSSIYLSDVFGGATGTSAADCYSDVSGGVNAAVERSLSDEDCNAIEHFISNNAGFRGRASMTRPPREIARLFPAPVLCALRRSHRWLRGSMFWPRSFGVRYHCSGSSGFESFGLHSLSKYFGFNLAAPPLRSRERPSKQVSLIFMLFLTSDVSKGDVPCYFYSARYTIKSETDALVVRISRCISGAPPVPILVVLAINSL